MKSSISVRELKSINFHDIDPIVKICIKNLGRPTPVQNIDQENCVQQRGYINGRIRDFYKERDWICWCDDTSSFYCFPCILCGGTKEWTERGMEYSASMRSQIRKHENSIKHLKNIKTFACSGKTNILSDTNLTKEMKNKGPFHIYEMGGHTRVILDILDWIETFDGFNQPEKSHTTFENSEDSPNSSYLQRLIELIRNSWLNIKIHSEDNTQYNCIPEKIAHKILNCVLYIRQQHTIIQEIKQSLFLSIIVSEISENSRTPKAALILRYVKEIEVVERFWCFLHPAVKDPKSTAEIILTELEQIIPNCPEKLISQSYDGSLAMRNVYKRIKEVYFNAHYIHSYTHELYFVLKVATSKNGKAKCFFSSLNRVLSFFIGAPQLQEDFNTMIKKRHEDAPSFNWDFSMETIEELHEHLYILLEFLQNLIDDPSVNKDASDEAFILKYLLENKEFIFWLEVFYSIAPYIKTLNDERMLLMGKSVIDQTVAEFLCGVKELKNSTNKVKNTYQLIRGKIYSVKELAALKYNTRHVCGLLKEEFIVRFHFTDHFDLISILLAENLTSHKTVFPQNKVESVIKNFSNFQNDRSKLYEELYKFYQTDVFTKFSNPQELLKHILKEKLETQFSSIVRLIKLVLTLSVGSSKFSTGFSTLSDLREVLEKINPMNHSTVITSMYMEKGMTMNIPDFRTKMINLLLSEKSKYYTIIE